jgi:mannose-6-phosphate isomerase-like protein (cupin superfamily)
MMESSTMTLPADFDVLAPDGSQVRILLALAGGSMAHFTLPRGQVSGAVRHRTVGEIWYVLSGTGEMWRSDNGTVPLEAGTCLTIPLGVAFQFRCVSDEALTAVAVTMPPWPGDDEAESVLGKWEPTGDPRIVGDVTYRAGRSG